MTKRYKIKQWFKKHFNKDKIMPIILTLIIALIVGLCIYFENKDIEQQKQKYNDITIQEDNINLNTSFIINTDGNLVGSNLLDPSTISSGKYLATSTGLLWDSGGDWYTSDYILIPRGNDLYIKNFNALCLYDNNKTFIEGSGLNYDDYTSTHNYHITTSNDVRYIRITALSIVQTMVSYEDLNYEPYGVWYSPNNYNLNGTLKYNEGMAEYQKTYYYFNNKTASVYYDNGQYDGQHLGDILLTQTSYTNYSIDITSTLESWVEDISRAAAFRIDIPINLKSSEVFINASWPTSTADGYFKVYYDDGTSYNVPQTTFSSGLFVYDGSSTNSDKYVLKVSYQIVYDVIDSINITTSPSVIYYNNGYNEGYDIGFSSGVSTGQSNGFTNGYNNGYQIGYNEGATKDLTTNGFQTLCNSILSYPVNLISKVFNFEFMGINIASTIFFLISCGIVLWIIKRLWK